MALDKKFEHLKIELEAIKKATNNFADEYCIGKGGFGLVYKGELIKSGWPTLVAIKQLDRKFGQGDPEFWKEIIMLSRYRHENVVSLLGFCDDSGEKILVYEYASRRSLDRYLNSSEISWIRRLNICIGAARGLAYLHDPGESQQRVLHRDIKSSNILLDENWNARISDFGLSKFGPANQKDTFMVSHAVGTHGYVDPLYMESGFLTKESDVYSFGVMLFEVLCGRLCTDKNGKHLSFTRLIRYHYKNNKMDEIVYSNIRNNMSPDSLKAFAKIAYQCLEIDQYEQRPLMTTVVSQLQSALQNQASYNDSIRNLLQENKTDMSTGKLLNIEPHELLFSFALMKRVTCVIQLTNKTDSHVAFKVEPSCLEKYIVDRNIGIVLPYDTCDVIATMEAQMVALPNMECKDMFLIQCAVVSGGTRTKDITQELFNKKSWPWTWLWNQVEECKLKVKYIYAPMEQPLLPEAEVLEEASSSTASTSDNVTVLDTAELLYIEPEQLRFPFELRKQTSCSMQLKNKTDSHVAYKVKSTNAKEYCIRPNQGIVLPHSTCDVIVIKQALKDAPPDMQLKDKFMVQSVVASSGTAPENITREMFNEESGNLVEEFLIKATYVAPSQPLSPVREGTVRTLLRRILGCLGIS